MPKFQRREVLYVVAAGVGAAYGIQEIRPDEKAVIPAVGGGEDDDGEGGRDGEDLSTPTSTPSATATEIDLKSGGNLGSISDIESDIVAQLEFVTGVGRDYGLHVTYDGSLPIEAVGNGYEVAIVDALGDESAPDTYPQFVYVVGENRDYGAHVKYESSPDHIEENDFAIAFGESLSAIDDASTTPQGDHVFGENRDYGTHVEE